MLSAPHAGAECINVDYFFHQLSGIKFLSEKQHRTEWNRTRWLALKIIDPPKDVNQWTFPWEEDHKEKQRTKLTKEEQQTVIERFK